MNRIALMILRNLFKAPPAMAKLNKYSTDPKKYPEQEMWEHIQYILQRAIKGGNVELVCTGTENIPKEGGCLLYGNHQGLFDVLAIAATCDLPLSVVAKKELKDVFFLKQVLICTDAYIMDREDPRQSLRLMRKVAEDAKAGRRIVIFPEGTRSKKGNVMNDFHDGSFKPALKAQCPIVPMAFVNSFLPLDQKGSDPVKVHIHYLEPIPYEEFKDMKTPQIAELVQSRIQEKIDEVCREEGLPTADEAASSEEPAEV